jgi:hypothetical protein
VRAGVAPKALVVDGEALPEAIVVIALPSPRTGGGSAPIGPAAVGALDEPRKEVVALAPPSGVALVLLQAALFTAPARLLRWYRRSTRHESEAKNEAAAKNL